MTNPSVLVRRNASAAMRASYNLLAFRRRPTTGCRGVGVLNKGSGVCHGNRPHGRAATLGRSGRGHRLRSDSRQAGWHGMAWWNALTEELRAGWLQGAGTTVPADAWVAYKRSA